MLKFNRDSDTSARGNIGQLTAAKILSALLRKKATMLTKSYPIYIPCPWVKTHGY